MGKPTPKQFDCGDLAVSSNGETYYPHEGEWVSMFTDLPVGGVVELVKWERLGVELAAAKDDPVAASHISEILESRFGNLYDWISSQVVDWNWTDNRGKPYPNPYENPEVLKKLNIEELMYLLKAGQGETPGPRKKGLKPSPTTSSVIG